MAAEAFTSIGTGAAANITSDTSKGIFQIIVSSVKYVIIYQKNVDKYNDKLKTLRAKRKSVQQEIDAATRNVAKIKPDVDLWCKNVDKAIEEEEKEVKDLEEKAKKKCFVGLCPNIYSRYKLSKKAEEDCGTFDELVLNCQFQGSVAHRDVPEATVERQKDFEDFESRQMVFNNIMEALKDGRTRLIGVHGKKGVGKTTLVNEIARQVQLVKSFNWVVTATVSENPDILDIQDQIAEPLGLEFTEKTQAARANRLCKRLKNEKKVLVILDDIHKRVDLKDIGIPSEDQYKRCKILLISREEDVVSNEMDAEKSFEVGALEEFESLDLFKKITGDVAETDELRPIATEIARNCAALPEVIAKVARGLRHKQAFEWKNALHELQTKC
ncbi:Disease resistance protein [Corchorus olitorius]|uniref:Disease resistance protein n=1 Tax=Corchorus olitorius TaxID=93759 RepID=A0A1R3JW51_9ROSI|nr:Disease resistance protein [Corchorus olitorius]